MNWEEVVGKFRIRGVGWDVDPYATIKDMTEEPNRPMDRQESLIEYFHRQNAVLHQNLHHMRMENRQHMADYAELRKKWDDKQELLTRIGEL